MKTGNYTNASTTLNTLGTLTDEMGSETAGRTAIDKLSKKIAAKRMDDRKIFNMAMVGIPFVKSWFPVFSSRFNDLAIRVRHHEKLPLVYPFFGHEPSTSYQETNTS